MDLTKPDELKKMVEFHRYWSAKGIVACVLGMVDGLVKGSGLERDRVFARLLVRVALAHQAPDEVQKRILEARAANLAPSWLNTVAEVNWIKDPVTMLISKISGTDPQKSLWPNIAAVIAIFLAFLWFTRDLFWGRRRVQPARVEAPQETPEEKVAREAAQKSAEEEKAKRRAAEKAARVKKEEDDKKMKELKMLLERFEKIKQKKDSLDKKADKSEDDKTVLEKCKPIFVLCNAIVEKTYTVDDMPALQGALSALKDHCVTLEEIFDAYEKAEKAKADKQVKYALLLEKLKTVKTDLEELVSIPAITAQQQAVASVKLAQLGNNKATIEREKEKGWQTKTKELDKEMEPSRKRIQQCEAITASYKKVVAYCAATTPETFPLEKLEALEKALEGLIKERAAFERIIEENNAVRAKQSAVEKSTVAKRMADERAEREELLERFNARFAKSSVVANDHIQRIAAQLSEMRRQDLPAEKFPQFEAACNVFSDKCFEVVRLLSIPHENMSLDALKLHIDECAAADEPLNEAHPERVAVAKMYAELQTYVAERERKVAARRRAEQNIVNNNNHVEETPAAEESTAAARKMERVISVRSINVEYGRDLKPHELIKKQREEEREQNLGWMETPVMHLLYRLTESVNDTSADYQFYPLLGQYSLLYRFHELQLFLLTAFHYHHKDKTGEKDPVAIPLLFQSQAVGGFATDFWSLLMHSYHKVTCIGLLDCVQIAYCIKRKKIKDKVIYDPKMLDEKVQDVVCSTSLFQDLSEGEEDKQHHSVTGLLTALELAFKHLVEIEKFALKDSSNKLLPHYQESCRMLIMIIGELDQQFRLVKNGQAVFRNKLFQGHLAKYLEKCHESVRNPLRHGRTDEEYEEFKRLKELLTEVKNAKNERNYKVLSEKLKEAEELQERIYRRFKDAYEDAKAGRSICMDVMSFDEVAALVEEGRKIFKENPKLFESIQGTMSKWLKKHGGEWAVVAEKRNTK